MLDWTLGEVLITLLENDSVMISQGFHQPDYRLVSSRPIIVNPANIKVFPNPFSDQLIIQSTLLSGKNGVVHLADITGKVFWQKQIDGASIQEYSFGESLSPGYYVLSIQLFGDPGLYTIPVINLK
jgi:hypothetical protein